MLGALYLGGNMRVNRRPNGNAVDLTLKRAKSSFHAAR